MAVAPRRPPLHRASCTIPRCQCFADVRARERGSGLRLRGAAFSATTRVASSVAGRGGYLGDLSELRRVVRCEDRGLGRKIGPGLAVGSLVDDDEILARLRMWAAEYCRELEAGREARSGRAGDGRHARCGPALGDLVGLDA